MKRILALGLLLSGSGMVCYSDVAPVVIPVHIAASRKLINVQGKITDNTGKLISGTVTVTFRLYGSLTDLTAAAVWLESQNVATANGLFNVTLGSVASLDPIAFNRPYYLGMQVAGDLNELQPRQLLGASAYALGSLGDFNVQGNITGSGNLKVNSVTVSTGVTIGGQDVQSFLVPVGAIMMFATDCPSGWARFTAMDNYFPKGSATYGTTGGAATHAHGITADGNHAHSIPPSVTVPTNDPAGKWYLLGSPTGWSPYVFGQNTQSSGSHSHGGSTQAANSLPPFLDILFCQKL